jgi:hypothetical protein
MQPVPLSRAVSPGRRVDALTGAPLITGGPDASR